MSEGIENIRGIDGIDGIESVRREVDAMEEALEGEDRRDADREPDAERNLEAPEADSAEQRADLLPQDDEPATAGRADRDGEANPADTAEQRRVAGVDEEDYR
ncbi:hypothetical protein V2S66_30505 [Streptomyces sp. V4-01]|uniref:Uncharacterized protein n=1 Tax=Actinacidiphila polyblastidii TaxID=3110430 RepID=A0ABU7PKH1_9ACTN|nr:hypothetical protein [Streptomyces sp. V4-01]